MAESTPLSLGEVMAAMSIAVDIGMGQPLEQGLGVCVLAVRFGEVLGLDENDRQSIFEIALLRHIGCTAETVDFASIMGAELAAGAARRIGLPESDLRRAGWLHDVGRVGVSSVVWEKPGPLTHAEREQVRLHPYYTERILARPASLAALGRLAASHHERLDGSGYHRRVGAAALSTGERLLAAADAYSTLVESRPHRPAMDADRAAGELRASARAGRLDAELVEAVLATAGHAPHR